MEDARDHEDEWMPVDDAVLDILDDQNTGGAEQSQTGAQYQGAIVNEVDAQIPLGHKGAERVAEDQTAGQEAEANCSEEWSGRRIRLAVLYIMNIPAVGCLLSAVTHPHSWGRI